MTDTQPNPLTDSQRQALVSLLTQPKTPFDLSREEGDPIKSEVEFQTLIDYDLVVLSGSSLASLTEKGQSIARLIAVTTSKAHIMAEYAARGVPLPTDRTPSLEHARSQRRAEPNKD